MQAHRALRKGVECALLYVRTSPQTDTSSSLTAQAPLIAPTMSEGQILEPRMTALVAKYQHMMLKDGLPPQLPPSRPEDHHIDLVPGAIPPSQSPYRISKALEGELGK